MLLSPFLLGGCGDLTTPPPTHPEGSGTTTATIAELPDNGRFGGARNFVVNPSFEDDLRGWAPWTDASVIATSRAQPRFGRASASVRAAAATPYGISLPGVVSAPSRADVFVFSAWFRTADRPKRLTVLVLAYGLGDVVETVARRVVKIGTEWQRLRMRARVRGANRSSLSIFIGQMDSIGAGDGFFVDGVQLTLEVE